MRSWLTMLVLLVICTGCDAQSDQQFIDKTATQLPVDATNIQLAGNGWVTFEWKGQKFLYRHNSNPADSTSVTETCVSLGPATQPVIQSTEVPVLKLEDLQKK